MVEFRRRSPRAMELITILNRCHRFRGFVYQRAHFSADKKSIEVAVRPRKGSAAVCSRCHLPAPGYDQLAERRFEFIPWWGFLVFLLYTMRRVDCRRCGVVAVEEVPWGAGKRTLTKAYMLFLARWAARSSRPCRWSLAERRQIPPGRLLLGAAGAVTDAAVEQGAAEDVSGGRDRGGEFGAGIRDRVVFHSDK